MTSEGGSDSRGATSKKNDSASKDNSRRQNNRNIRYVRRGRNKPHCKGRNGKETKLEIRKEKSKPSDSRRRIIRSKKLHRIQGGKPRRRPETGNEKSRSHEDIDNKERQTPNKRRDAGRDIPGGRELQGTPRRRSKHDHTHNL